MRFDSVYPPASCYRKGKDSELAEWSRDDCGNVIAWYWRGSCLLHDRFIWYTKKEIVTLLRARGVKVGRKAIKALYEI